MDATRCSRCTKSVVRQARQKNIFSCVETKTQHRAHSVDESAATMDGKKIAEMKQKQKTKIADALAPEPMHEDEKKTEFVASSGSATSEQAAQTSTTPKQAAKESKPGSGKSSNSKKSSAAAAKREKRTIGEYYKWTAADDVLSQFDVRFSDADFEALKQRVHANAKECDVTIDDVLAMKANVMNQREAEKLLQIAQKQKELRDAAEQALGTLLARAQVDKKQREARELKKKLVASRKQSNAE